MFSLLVTASGMKLRDKFLAQIKQFYDGQFLNYFNFLSSLIFPSSLSPSPSLSLSSLSSLPLSRSLYHPSYSLILRWISMLRRVASKYLVFGNRYIHYRTKIMQKLAACYCFSVYRLKLTMSLKFSEIIFFYIFLLRSIKQSFLLRINVYVVN